MSDAHAELLLNGLALYLGCGALFAACFCACGAGRLAAAAGRASWTFRLLLAPAAVALWPWLAWQWATVIVTRREAE